MCVFFARTTKIGFLRFVISFIVVNKWSVSSVSLLDKGILTQKTEYCKDQYIPKNRLSRAEILLFRPVRGKREGCELHFIVVKIGVKKARKSCDYGGFSPFLSRSICSIQKKTGGQNPLKFRSAGGGNGCPTGHRNG